MAQLKDLLVTGPVRLIGSVNFSQRPKHNNENLALTSEVTAAEARATAVANDAATSAGNANANADTRVLRAGDTMTGNLNIDNGANPYVSLTETAADTTTHKWYF